jgi:hypothetical protein
MSWGLDSTHGCVDNAKIMRSSPFQGLPSSQGHVLSLCRPGRCTQYSLYPALAFPGFPNFPTPLEYSSALPALFAFEIPIGSRRTINSAPTTNCIWSRPCPISPCGHGDAQMISTNRLSQPSLSHEPIGNARYVTHLSEDSSISSPGLAQSEHGQFESSRENRDQPNLKRRISEIDSQEGMNASNKSVRRRISRACDQCNQLRTKVLMLLLTF